MISLSNLRQFKADGRKFSCLTCYDASMAKAMEIAEIDSILIGDSLGMSIQGRDSTLPVTVADMAYHTAAVRRGNQHAFIMTDLPFMSYATLNDALVNSKTVMQAGAQMVKMEGGAWLSETVKKLLKLGYEVSGMIWDEPGESESFSCKTEADIDKYANDYDEIGCYEDKVKVLIRADYTHIFPMVLGKKECVDEILNLLGLNSNELK